MQYETALSRTRHAEPATRPHPRCTLAPAEFTEGRYRSFLQAGRVSAPKPMFMGAEPDAHFSFGQIERKTDCPVVGA